jgi:COMPASS component SPP1
MAPGIRTGSSSDDESNDGGEYCTCRGPDDHRMMVYCDGGCNDWYHCSCVGIEEADAKELLDRFICPKCKTDTLFTTWKRFCRYGNVGKFTKDPNLCRKAARVSDDPPSKYCSDAHKDMFWVWVRDHLARKDDEPAVPGGRLSVGEVGWILKQCKTIEEIQALGKKPKLPINEGADPSKSQSSSPCPTHMTDHIRQSSRTRLSQGRRCRPALQDHGPTRRD